jgi:hypothetical protein
MDFTERHREAEADFRRMLEDGGVAPPDDVEALPGELVFRWNEQKLAVVVELDPGPAKLGARRS